MPKQNRLQSTQEFTETMTENWEILLALLQMLIPGHSVRQEQAQTRTALSVCFKMIVISPDGLELAKSESKVLRRRRRARRFYFLMFLSLNLRIGGKYIADLRGIIPQHSVRHRWLSVQTQKQATYSAFWALTDVRNQSAFKWLQVLTKYLKCDAHASTLLPETVLVITVHPYHQRSCLWWAVQKRFTDNTSHHSIKTSSTSSNTIGK